MHKKYFLPLFLVFQIAVLQVIRFFPGFVERFYSKGLYVFISGLSRTFLGKIPFSIGDVIYIIVIILVLKWLWQNRKSWKTSWKDNVFRMISCISIFYFLFHFLWAMNYYRVPLFDTMDIKREYADEELFAFTRQLIAKTNAVQLQLTHNKDLKVVTPYSQEQIFEMTQNGFDALSGEYVFFEYKKPSIKKSLFSLPLTYMGFGGYLNPFSNEAQVNDKLPIYGFPMVVCHEMAHQMGRASESEANFVGFLGAIKNKDLYFQYSAYAMALRYCLRNIEIRDEKRLQPFMDSINKGILKNYDESEAFWKQYETPVESGFKIFYDNFLKMNQQKDGLESYSKFLDLLVNYYKGRML